MVGRDLKIISGGQTGVDRAALDAALDVGAACGGFVPAGRRAEDGRIPDRYPVIEIESKKYAVRTKGNIEASDGTLIVYRGELTGGTALTWRHAANHGNPVLSINVDDAEHAKVEGAATAVAAFVAEHDIAVLNVAGRRASQDADLGAYAYDVVKTLLVSLGYDVDSFQSE